MEYKTLYALYVRRRDELLPALERAGGWRETAWSVRIGPTWPGGCHKSSKQGSSHHITLRPDGSFTAWCYACEADALYSIDALLGWSKQGFPDGKPHVKQQRKQPDWPPRVGGPLRSRNCPDCGYAVLNDMPCPRCCIGNRTPEVSWAPAQASGSEVTIPEELQTDWAWRGDLDVPKPAVSAGLIYSAVQQGELDHADELAEQLLAEQPAAAAESTAAAHNTQDSWADAWLKRQEMTK